MVQLFCRLISSRPSPTTPVVFKTTNNVVDFCGINYQFDQVIEDDDSVQTLVNIARRECIVFASLSSRENFKGLQAIVQHLVQESSSQETALVATNEENDEKISLVDEAQSIEVAAPTISAAEFDPNSAVHDLLNGKARCRDDFTQQPLLSPGVLDFIYGQRSKDHTLVVCITTQTGRVTLVDAVGVPNLESQRDDWLCSTVYDHETVKLVLSLDPHSDKQAVKLILHPVGHQFRNYQSKFPTTSIITSRGFDRVQKLRTFTLRRAIPAQAIRSVSKLVVPPPPRLTRPLTQPKGPAMANLEERAALRQQRAAAVRTAHRVNKAPINRARTFLKLLVPPLVVSLALPIKLRSPLNLPTYATNPRRVRDNREIEALRADKNRLLIQIQVLLTSVKGLREVQGELKQIASVYREFRAEFAVIARRLLEKENQVKQLNLDAVTLNSQVQAFKDEVQSLSTVVDTVRRELGCLYEEKNSLLEERTSLCTENDSLKTRLAVVDENVRQIEGQYVKTKEELNRQQKESHKVTMELTAKHDSLVANHELLVTRYAELEEAHSDLKLQHSHGLTSHTVLQKSHAELKSHHDKLQSNHSELEDNLANLQKAYTELEGKHATLRITLDTLEASRNELQKTHEALLEQQNLSLASSTASAVALKDAESRVIDLEKELTKAKSDHEVAMATASVDASRLEEKLTTAEGLHATEIADLRARNAEFAREVALQKAEMHALTERLEQQDSEAADAASLQALVDDALLQLQSEIEAIRQTNVDLAEDKLSLEEEITSLRALTEEKNQQLTHLQSTATEAQNVLEAVQARHRDELAAVRAQVLTEEAPSKGLLFELPKFDASDIFADNPFTEPKAVSPEPQLVPLSALPKSSSDVLKPMENYRDKTHKLLLKKRRSLPLKLKKKKLLS